MIFLKNIIKNKITKQISSSFIIASLIGLSGCSGLYKKNPKDPFETYNRDMFRVNMAVNKVIVTPITKVYTTILPPFVRTGVGNFFDNVYTIPSIANDLLQGKPKLMGRDVLRLLINTTLGIGGLFDVAENMGLPNNPQSFSRTLYVWGWKDSAYFVVPFLGPNTVRGTAGLVPEYFMNPIKYLKPDWLSYTLTGLNFVQTASVQLPRMRELSEVSVDPYVAIRNAYMQNLKYSYSLSDKKQNKDLSTSTSTSTSSLNNQKSKTNTISDSSYDSGYDSGYDSKPYKTNKKNKSKKSGISDINPIA